MDDRGRVLIPKALREKFHLAPGTVVQVREHDGGVQIAEARKANRREALRRLVATAHDELRHARGPRMNPLDLKKIWEPRV